MLLRMKKLNLMQWSAVLGLFSLPFFASAKDEEQDLSKYKLSDCSVGDVVEGTPVDLAALKGKVVALEMWGHH